MTAYNTNKLCIRQQNKPNATKIYCAGLVQTPHMLGENIKRRRQQLGLTQEDLAKAVGQSQQNIQQFEGGIVNRPRYLDKLLKFLNLTYEQAVSGSFEPQGSLTKRESGVVYFDSPPDESTVEFVRELHPGELTDPRYEPDLPDIHPRKQGKSPLISWVQAGAAEMAIDLFEPGDAERWLICPVEHSVYTYILRVRGDSMTSPYGKTYPDGCLIFVDPEQRGGVVPGNRVIAKINGQNEVTFKQLASDDGRLFLKPLNPQYRPIYEEFRILGKVIFKGEEE